MTSSLILKFYYVTINLQAINWPNYATSDHHDAKKNKAIQCFHKIFFHDKCAESGKWRVWLYESISVILWWGSTQKKLNFFIFFRNFDLAKEGGFSLLLVASSQIVSKVFFMLSYILLWMIIWRVYFQNSLHPFSIFLS